MTAQIIVFLDSQGVPHAELPGINGAARRQVELGPFWTDRNPEIMQTLQAEAQEQEIRNKRLGQLARERKIQAENEAAERERRSNESIAREKMADWQRRYDSATPEVRAGMERQRDRIIEANRNRAKDIWMGLATDHDVALANKAINDRSRRPNKRVSIAGGRSYNPATEKTFDKNGKQINKPKTPKKQSWQDADIALAVNIKL